MCDATKTIPKMLHATPKKVKRVCLFFMLHPTFLLHETNIFEVLHRGATQLNVYVKHKFY